MTNIEILLAFIAFSVGLIGLQLLVLRGELAAANRRLEHYAARIAQAAEDGVYEDWDDSGRDMIATLDAWSGDYDVITKGLVDDPYVPTKGV
ncbi:hypothetical protein [Methylocystis sp. ATCC 49242]|uniref:hypothetical protein n=1 Tax=Methylocystis sp. ATCC 49242 TaxID=622637 RepID=UPI001187067F|nr:hypothetical protein [Methylocystis sp. ATCC 49242]